MLLDACSGGRCVHQTDPFCFPSDTHISWANLKVSVSRELSSGHWEMSEPTPAWPVKPSVPLPGLGFSLSRQLEKDDPMTGSKALGNVRVTGWKKSGSLNVCPSSVPRMAGNKLSQTTEIWGFSVRADSLLSLCRTLYTWSPLTFPTTWVVDTTIYILGNWWGNWVSEKGSNVSRSQSFKVAQARFKPIWISNSKAHLLYSLSHSCYQGPSTHPSSLPGTLDLLLTVPAGATPT